MRLIVVFIGLSIALGFLVVIGGRIGAQEVSIHSDMSTRQLQSALSTAASALGTQVSSGVTGLDVTTAPASLSSTVGCGAQTCSWTATRGNETHGNGTATQVVFGGGGSRTDSNDNVGTDPAGHPVANELLYRLTLSMPSGVVLPFDVAIQLLDTNPISFQVLGMRLDRAALQSSSVAYADQLCGNASMGCSVVTAGADTTVVNAQNGCWAPPPGGVNDPTVQTPCSPLGNATPTPAAANNYQTRSTQDGSILH